MANCSNRIHENSFRPVGCRALIRGLLILAALPGPMRTLEGAMNNDPVRYLPDLKVWVLNTDRTSYLVGVNERGELQNIYWGEMLASDGDLAAAHSRREHASFDSPETMTNLEYPGWGARYYNEPSLKVMLADGDRDLVLHYVSHEIHGDTLVIRLKDIQYDLFVKLTYKVFAREDVIRKEA